MSQPDRHNLLYDSLQGQKILGSRGLEIPALEDFFDEAGRHVVT
jgi:hypothetical protein